MVYGISYEYASLPGDWWLHAIILLVMMITLAYLEVRVGREGAAILLTHARALALTYHRGSKSL